MHLPNASSFQALTRRHRRHGRPQIFKTKVINQLSPIGYITPAEAEEAFYANLNVLDMVA